MSKIDPDDLHPTLISRLHAELNRVWPPAREPRYLTAAAPIRAWRFAPLALAIAFTGIVALTAFAATGSPNPAVWTNRVQTVINSSLPSPTPDESPSPAQPAAAPTAPPTHRTSATPTPRPTGSPDHESPEPEDHSGSSSTASGSRTASPSDH
jgi:hypothetical protein